MQITLNQEEILMAIEGYVRQQINIAEGQSISIELKATRGETGFTALLDIISGARTSAPQNASNAPVSAPVAAAPAAPATVAPAAPKPIFNKLKAEAKAAPAAEPDPIDELVNEDPPAVSEEDLADAADSADVPEDDDADDTPPAAPAPRSIFSKKTTNA